MVNIGILGLGGIAQLSHLPMLYNLPEEFTVVAGYDPSPSVSHNVAHRYNVPKLYDTSEALIADPNVQAVLVLTPDPMHATLAKACIEAGKHVLVEKPLAMNSDDIRMLVETQKAHPGVVAMVGYMRRFAYPFLKAKELLAADERPIQYLRFRDIILEGGYYVGQTTKTFSARKVGDMPAGSAEKMAEMKYAQHSVGLGQDATEMQRNAYQMLLGLGCHTFSAVRELVGLPKEVKSVLTSGNGTHFASLLQYDGFIGVYEMVNDQEVVQFDAAIEIYQGDRRLKIKYETPYIRFLPHSLVVDEHPAGGEARTTVYGPHYGDAFQSELAYFHECITQGKAPKTSLEDALEDITLFEQMAKMVTKEG